MVKHELDNEPRKYNLRAKKQRTEVAPPSLHSARADAKKTSARKSTPKSRTKRQNNHSRLALDTLPAELIRGIYLDLDAPAMLAFKFVSKTLYETTMDQKGEEVINITEHAREARKLRRLYAMLILIESEVPFTIRVDRLTCSSCHHTMTHAPSQREPGLKEKGVSG